MDETAEKVWYAKHTCSLTPTLTPTHTPVQFFTHQPLLPHSPHPIPPYIPVPSFILQPSLPHSPLLIPPYTPVQSFTLCPHSHPHLTPSHLTHLYRPSFSSPHSHPHLTPPHPTHLYSPSFSSPRRSISEMHKSITLGTKGCVSLKGHASSGTPKVVVSLLPPVISFLNFDRNFLESSGKRDDKKSIIHTMRVTQMTK